MYAIIPYPILTCNKLTPLAKLLYGYIASISVYSPDGYPPTTYADFDLLRCAKELSVRPFDVASAWNELMTFTNLDTRKVLHVNVGDGILDDDPKLLPDDDIYFNVDPKYRMKDRLFAYSIMINMDQEG